MLELQEVKITINISTLVETEVREGGLTEFCQVFVHIDVAEVRIQRCELLFKVSGI